MMCLIDMYLRTLRAAEVYCEPAYIAYFSWCVNEKLVKLRGKCCLLVCKMLVVGSIAFPKPKGALGSAVFAGLDILVRINFL